MTTDEIEKTGSEITRGIGSRVKLSRFIRKISIEEMADTLRLLPEQYKEVEEGTNELDCLQYLLLNRLYGISIDWLIGGEDYEEDGKIILLDTVENEDPASQGEPVKDLLKIIIKDLEPYEAAKESNYTAEFERKVQDEGLETTQRLGNLLKLLQIPEINTVIYGKMLECIKIFNDQIATFSKEPDDPGE
jgi:transcriptional regulator with XRE-family HTH domain